MDNKLLEELSNSFGPSGFEADVKKLIGSKLTKLKIAFKEDKLGNIIAKLGSVSSKKKPKILLDAHMDEVGFIIKHITRGGFLNIVTLGGVAPSVLVSSLVKLKSDDDKFITGVTTTTPPHVSKDKKPEVEDIYIDIGAKSAADVEKLNLRVGSPGLIDFNFKKLFNQRFLGKAFDDRVGCCLLLELAKKIGKNTKLINEFEFYISFSVQEEMGLRGIAAVIEEVEPDLFLAVEGTICADIPGLSDDKKITELGLGPAITVMDRGIVTNPKLIKFITNVASKNKIPYQFKTPAFGGTNSGMVHKMKKGINALTVAVPCRYIHTQQGMLSSTDYDHTLKLLESVVKAAKPVLK